MAENNPNVEPPKKPLSNTWHTFTVQCPFCANEERIRILGSGGRFGFPTYPEHHFTEIAIMSSYDEKMVECIECHHLFVLRNWRDRMIPEENEKTEDA